MVPAATSSRSVRRVVEFEDEGAEYKDAGTVVGSLPKAPLAVSPPGAAVRASPAVRTQARELGIDLASVKGTGPGGAVTSADLDVLKSSAALAADYEPLRGVRRAMAVNMARSALEVPGSTVTDEVVVGHWPKDADVTLRLIRAVAAACRAEPALNASFDKTQMARKLHTRIDLGVALNTGDGLFVPVLRDVSNRNDKDLRAGLEAMKRDVAARKVPAAELKGQTITLSNFGMIGGLNASLAIVPPQVAILGAGRIFNAVRPVDSEIRITKVMPLSLTFDHRVVTGAEATRFLNAVVADLKGRCENAGRRPG